MEVWALYILAGSVTSEFSNLFVISAYDDVAILVVSDRPNSFRQLDGLFALAIGPELDCAVVAACHDLASVQAVNSKNESAMATIVHHVGAIHGPEFDDLVVRDAGKTIHLGDLTETAHNIFVS